MSELLAKDMYRELPPREVVGARLVERVGGRAWRPPRFAPGRSLFGRCGIPDPWDPSVAQVDVGLGDVGLKDDRRQPAPHATPPAAPGSAAPKLPNVPAAKPKSAEEAKGRPAPQIGTTRRVEAGELKPKADTVTTRPKAPPKRDQPPSAFGGGPVHHAVAKLPVRPNFSPAEPAKPAPAPMKLGLGLGAPATPKPALSVPSRPGAGAEPGRSVPPAAVSRPGAPPGAPALDAAPRPVPTPPPPAVRPETSAAPASEPVAAPEPRVQPPKAAPPPVNRRPPSQGGGLDDLFGMGGGENTRLKLNRGPAEGDGPKPNRPRVSTPEELEKLGIDRRPPPPKAPPPPPGVAPAAKPTASRDDDLPDE